MYESQQEKARYHESIFRSSFFLHSFATVKKLQQIKFRLAYYRTCFDENDIEKYLSFYFHHWIVIQNMFYNPSL